MFNLTKLALLQNFGKWQKNPIATMAYQFRVVSPIYYPDRQNETRHGNRFKFSEMVHEKQEDKFPKDYYYHLLGVRKEASNQQIKAAYYSLAKMFHPDSSNTGQKAEQFKDISNAYHILTDETKRAEYDQFGVVRNEKAFLDSVSNDAKTKMLQKQDKGIPKPRMETPKLDKGIPKPRMETPKLDKDIPKPRMETPKLDKDIPKLRMETPKIDKVITKTRTETPKQDKGIPKTRMEIPKTRMEIPKIRLGIPKIEMNIPETCTETPEKISREVKKHKATPATTEDLIMLTNGEPTLELTFVEAAQGFKKNFDLRFLKKCPNCLGKSTKQVIRSSPELCKKCGGSGYVNNTTSTFQTSMICDQCRGKRYINRNSCDVCDSRGILVEKITVSVPIPAGVKTGDVISIENPLTNQSVNYRLRLLDSDYFTRVGNDVHSDKTLTFTQAIFGGTFKIRGLFEDLFIRVEPGTQSHTEIIVKGQGIKMRKETSGDHIVTIKVLIPQHLTAKQRQLLQAYAKTEID